jgi:hypothetical protein
MKLKPCVVRVKCPVCEGQHDAVDINGELSGNVCGVCGNRGELFSVVLAPVGYDGVSEVDFNSDIMEIFDKVSSIVCDVGAERTGEGKEFDKGVNWATQEIVRRLHYLKYFLYLKV